MQIKTKRPWTGLKSVSCIANPKIQRHFLCYLQQSPIFVFFWGGEGFGIQLSTVDAEFKFAKTPKCHFQGRGQSPTFDTESKFAEIPKSHFLGGGGGLGLGINSQLLMLSPKLLKSQSPISAGGGGSIPNF